MAVEGWACGDESQDEAACVMGGLVEDTAGRGLNGT